MSAVAEPVFRRVCALRGVSGREAAALRAIVEAAEAGRPLAAVAAAGDEPEALRALLTRNLAYRTVMRRGGAETAVVCPSPALIRDLHGPVPWTADDLAYLDVAYPAGVSFADMAARLERPGGAILVKALERGLARPGARRRRKSGRADAEVWEWTPAWRIARLRAALAEAEMRGANARDDGAGLEHRALARRFRMGRVRARALPERHGAPWDAADDARLRALLREGRTARAIAEAMGRSEKSVEWRVHELGLSTRRYWSEEEDRIVLEGVREGLSARAIAALLPGRTRGAVKVRAWKLTGRARGFARWNADEIASLERCYANGESVKAWAAAHGRPLSGVRWKARELGLRHPVSRGPYTRAEDEAIRAAYAQGRSIAACARALGRPLRSVYQRAAKIGLTHTHASGWRRYGEDEIARIRRLAAAGWSAREIGLQIGRTRSAVHRLAARHGIALTARGGRPAGERAAA